MKISRKNFLKTGAVITGGIFLYRDRLMSMSPEISNNFTTLRDNAGIYTERGGTIGWFANNDAFVVVDSQFPDAAKNFLDGVRKTVNRKIDVVLNSHHHADHTSGNIFFKDHASMIVAHAKCKELQQKFNGIDPSKPQAYPNVTFADEWTLDLGVEKIWAKHLCPAHTGGDSIIHFQKSNIVHMGDLVFNRMFPYIDLVSGGSIVKWIELLSKVEAMFEKDTIYIYGHSLKPEMCYGNIKDIRAMRNYLSALIDFVSKEIKSGKTQNQITSVDKIPGVNDVKEIREGMKKMNLEKAFEELTKQK